jgi:hypothetical protein
MPDQYRLSPLDGERPPFVAGTFFDLGTVGYEQAEYAIDATVHAYGRTGDGVAVVDEAPIRTRLIVYRPTDPSAFDGTVVVEWLNVSGGLDAAPYWMFTHRELIRSGSAYIGVSAQQVGVAGGAAAIAGLPGMALVELDPERYGSLHHPGDRFSYDLFSLAGSVARHGAGTILADLPVERVLAVGESQSALRLTTYVNDIDPLAKAYDGFLVHARLGAGAPLDDEVDPSRMREGHPVLFRDDLRVPVLCVQAETDLITLGYRDARQDDAERLVVWEIAGASHADVYTFVAGFADDGRQPVADLARGWLPTHEVVGMRLDLPVNAGPQHYVMQAAARSLVAWVRDGIRPPASPDLQLEGMGFATDDDGNALGGIRTPHVDVPVATLSGLGNSGAPMAFLTGSTVPFERDELVRRYGTRAGYVERFRASAEATVAAGFFLDDDLDEIVAIAELNVDL